MRYICKCGTESSITWQHFKQGSRCVQCGFDKQQKSSKFFKEYILPSGKIIKIQGYENLALDELLKRYSERCIITDRTQMPKITYILNGTLHQYYPDIYIPSENIIIEVKSFWTYNLKLVKNILKSLATRQLGFDFEFWIYTLEKQNSFNKQII